MLFLSKVIFSSAEWTWFGGRAGNTILLYSTTLWSTCGCCPQEEFESWTELLGRKEMAPWAVPRTHPQWTIDDLFRESCFGEQQNDNLPISPPDASETLVSCLNRKVTEGLCCHTTAVYQREAPTKPLRGSSLKLGRRGKSWSLEFGHISDAA